MDEQQAAAIEEMKAWAQKQLEFVVEEQRWTAGDGAYRILIGQERAFKAMLKKLEAMS